MATLVSAMSSSTSATTPPVTPYRQIRAQYNEKTITVYQVYSHEISSAAVATQKLSASPNFSFERMTWIKPSWNWTCYRSGYSYKDAHQSRILALKMKHEHFIELLRQSFTGHGAANEGNAVRVQWDPERTAELKKLPWRSIQIGISRDVMRKWVDEMIVEIEDVTERARELKRVSDDRGDVSEGELVELRLIPEERVYEVPEDVREILKIDEPEKLRREKQRKVLRCKKAKKKMDGVLQDEEH